MMRRTLRVSYPLLNLLGRQNVVQLRGAVDLEVALLPRGPAHKMKLAVKITHIRQMQLVLLRVRS